jgi:hypothetical protein
MKLPGGSRKKRYLNLRPGLCPSQLWSGRTFSAIELQSPIAGPLTSENLARSVTRSGDGPESAASYSFESTYPPLERDALVSSTVAHFTMLLAQTNKLLCGGLPTSGASMVIQGEAIMKLTIVAATLIALIAAAPASAENVMGGMTKQNGQCWKQSKSADVGTFGSWGTCPASASAPTTYRREHR